jgi:hypothetical protein
MSFPNIFEPLKFMYFATNGLWECLTISLWVVELFVFDIIEILDLGTLFVGLRVHLGNALVLWVHTGGVLGGEVGFG